MSKQRKERAMPEAEVVELQTKPAEPDRWAQIEQLKRRRADALAEREQLRGRVGAITLATTSGQGDAAEAELARIRSRLAAISNIEAETEAALQVAEARRLPAAQAEAVARRQGSRQRCAELADDRRQIAAEIDRLLSELNDMLRGYLAAGQMQTGALRGGGARVEAGPSDPIDAIRVCDAIVRKAPALVRMLRERGFAPSVIPADARPMMVHEALVQHRVESALEQAARHDLQALTAEAA
jgi:hypothetical protein